MILRHSNACVERFVRRHQDDPALTLAAFAVHAGTTPSARDRRWIEAYLRATRLLAGLSTTAGEPALEEPPANHHLLGRTVGGFTLDRIIGRGGTGAVFQGRTQTGQDVAIKLLHPGLAADPARLTRFRHEAATLRRLRHPNIVSVLESGETRDGIAFLAMEHIDGEGLDALLARGSVPRTKAERARQAARIGAALADALGHAHEHGLVHRDVKPGNVLLHRNGHPYLLDFGFARDAAQSRLTGSAEVLGTPVYMAPEQRDPVLGQVDARTDVFGLGVTLFEYATGRLPYPAASSAVFERLASVPATPRPLAAVLLRAIDPEPRHRYPTAIAFRDDLQRFLDGRPVAARPPGLVVRGLRRLRRHPAILAVLVAALAIAAAVATVSWQRHRLGQDALAESAALLADDRPADARNALARAAEFGAGDADLAARIDLAQRRERAERDFTEVRYLVADPDATAADLERADGVCAEVLAVREGRDRFEPLLIRSLVAFLRGDMLLAAKHGGDAAVNRAIPVTPEFVKALVDFATSMHRQARGTDLLRQFLLGEQFFAPELDRVLQLVTELREAHGAQAPEADPFYAVLLSSAGQPERSLEILDQVIERDPRHPSPLAILFKALALNRRGEPRLALEVVRNAIAASPRESAGLYALRARIQWRLGDAARTHADATQALQLNPDLRGARLLAIESLLALDRATEARSGAEAMVAEEPQNAQLHHLQAQACARLADVPTAMAAGRTALRILSRWRLATEDLRRQVLLDLMLWSSASQPPAETAAEMRRRLADAIAHDLPLLSCDDEDVRRRLQFAAALADGDDIAAAMAVLRQCADDLQRTYADPPADAEPDALKEQLRQTARRAAAELDTSPSFERLRRSPDFATVLDAWRDTTSALQRRGLGDLFRPR